jgi:hypothetical protein
VAAEWLETPFIRLIRVRHRVDHGQTEAARNEADDLFDAFELTGEQWYELAGVYSNLLKQNAGPRERLATRTIVALRRALEEGYQPRTPLQSDGQFQVVASLPEFLHLAAVRPR